MTPKWDNRSDPEKRARPSSQEWKLSPIRVIGTTSHIPSLAGSQQLLPPKAGVKTRDTRGRKGRNGQPAKPRSLGIPTSEHSHGYSIIPSQWMSALFLTPPVMDSPRLPWASSPAPRCSESKDGFFFPEIQSSKSTLWQLQAIGLCLDLCNKREKIRSLFLIAALQVFENDCHGLCDSNLAAATPDAFEQSVKNP